MVQEYRVHRATSRKNPKTDEPLRPARSTLHKEIIILRHVLKTAQRHGWVEYVPNLSPPYKTSGKISHRAWFSPEEYKQLYEATRERAKNPKHPRHREASARLHDFVLFMANTGMRPDEATRLQFRDVTIVTDAATSERILEIEVRGKRGVGYCKSMPRAVYPFQRLQARRPGQPTATLFGKVQREFFNENFGRVELEIRQRRQSAHLVQSAAHVHLHATDGRRRHLPSGKKLPHERRNDREVLCHAHQKRVGCRGYQRQANQAHTRGSAILDPRFVAT